VISFGNPRPDKPAAMSKARLRERVRSPSTILAASCQWRVMFPLGESSTDSEATMSN
jgi:hypothetical protein